MTEFAAMLEAAKKSAEPHCEQFRKSAQAFGEMAVARNDLQRAHKKTEHQRAKAKLDEQFKNVCKELDANQQLQLMYGTWSNNVTVNVPAVSAAAIRPAPTAIRLAPLDTALTATAAAAADRHCLDVYNFDGDRRELLMKTKMSCIDLILGFYQLRRAHLEYANDRRGAEVIQTIKDVEADIDFNDYLSLFGNSLDGLDDVPAAAVPAAFTATMPRLAPAPVAFAAPVAPTRPFAATAPIRSTAGSIEMIVIDDRSIYDDERTNGEPARTAMKRLVGFVRKTLELFPAVDVDEDTKNKVLEYTGNVKIRCTPKTKDSTNFDLIFFMPTAGNYAAYITNVSAENVLQAYDSTRNTKQQTKGVRTFAHAVIVALGMHDIPTQGIDMKFITKSGKRKRARKPT